MAKYSNTVEYQIRTTLDTSGLAKLKAELTSLQHLARSRNAQGIMGFDTATTNKVLADINKVKTALNQAFNPKLGMMNNRALFSSIGKDLNSIYSSFSKMGPQGIAAFGQVYGQIGKIDLGMKRISSTSDKIMNTFGNTFRWGMIASVFSGIMNSFHQSVQYVKDLDKSLTNIQMVTAQSREAMNDFAVQANEAAKKLGGTTVQMTNATEVFIRQGHSLETSTQLGQYAVHLANVSGQDSAMASDEITAYMNAFKIPVEDLGNAVSKWAAVANNAAVSVEELSVASQKAASVATTVGVDMDQFAAHIAAIEATTREAPENIGNGLKTIYSRIADVKLGETLEDGVDLGSFAKAIEKVGVEVLDQAGNLRDAGDIIQDLMGVWQDLDQTQRAALAKTVAGRFQLARFEALMNSADIYEKSLKVSQLETGTDVYDRMQETYRDSMEGRLNALSATVEGIFTKAFNTDDFYGMIDAATKLAEIFDDLVQAIGGGGQAILAFSAILTKTFSDKIGRGLSNMITNRATNAQAQENRQGAMMFAQAQLAGKGLNVQDKNVMALANNRAQINQYAPHMNNEQIELSNKLWEQQVKTFEQLTASEAKYAETTQAVKSVLVQLGMSAEQVDEEMIGLLQAIEAGGEQAQITKQVLQSLGIDALIDKIYNAESTITSFTQALRQAEMTNTGKSWTEAQERAMNLAIALEEIQAKAGFTGEKAELLTQALTGLHAVIDGDIKDIDGLDAALKKVGLDLDQWRNGLMKLQQVNGINIEELVQHKTQVEALTAAYKQLLLEGQGMAKGLQTQQLISGFANIASAAMTAMFAMQSFTNIFRILDNEDLTIGEKVEQLAMNITMVAAMGIPAITQTKAAIAEIKTSVLEWAAANLAQATTQEVAIATMEEAAAAEGGLTTAKIEEIATQSGLNKEELIAIAVKKEWITATEAETAAAAGKNIVLEKSISTLMMEKAATALVGTAYGKNIGQTILLAAARRGLIAVEEKETKTAAALTVAEVIAANAGKSLLLLAAPFIALAGILIGVGVALHKASEEEKERKERLAEEIKANQDAVDSIHEHRDNLVQLHAQYKQTGEASDEYKDALKEQAEALGIVNTNLLIATGQYEQLKEEIDAATQSTLGYNDALLQQQQKDNKSEISQSIFGMSSAAKEAAGLTGDLVTYAGGASTYVYDEDAITQINKINTAYEKNKETIADLRQELGALQAQNNNDQNTQRIKDIYDEIEAIQKLQDEYTELLSSDSAQSILSNQDQLIQNEILENQMSGMIGKNITYDDLYQKLTDANFFPQLNAYLAGLSEEDAQTYVHGLMGNIAESFNNESLMNEIGLKDASRNLTQSLMDTKDIDSDLAQKWADSLTQIEGFTELDDKTKIKILAGIDTEQSYWDMRNDIQDIIQRLKEGDTVEGISSAEDIVTMKPRDESVEEEAFHDLGRYIGDNAEDLDGFATSLKHDTDELANVTEAILRFDSALVESQEKIDDWEDALNSDNLEKKATAASELSDVYEDMLDIDDDISLSDTFVEDTENLELLKEAAEGTEEAYDELQRNAAEDILIQAKLDDSQIMSAMDDIAYVQDNLKNIDIGDAINDDAVIQKLENIVNAAGMTAEEASAFLSSIDVDIDPSGFEDGVAQIPDVAGTAAELAASAMNIITEVESGTAQEETSDTYYDVQADITPKPFTTTLPAGTEGGGTETLSGSVPEVIYTTVPHVASKVQETAGFAMKSKTANGKGGTGNLKIKKGAAKKGAGGGAKYNNAAHGRGSGGGGKGGGGGGGGGKGKTYEPKKKDFQKKEKDRYEKVNTAIDKIDSSIQNLTMDQDRLIGTRWADNLEKETKLLKEQVPWYEKKLEIQKQEAQELRNQLAKDYGAKFGKNGQLQNYSQLFDQLNSELEQAYRDYNNGKTEAAQEAAEKKIQDIEKRFDTFNKIYARYDTLWSKEMPETEKALKEIQDRLEDIAEEARKARREAAQNLDKIRETEKEIEKTFNNLTGEHPEINLAIDMERLGDLVDPDKGKEEINKWIDEFQKRLKSTTDKNMKDYYQKQINLLKKAAEEGTSVLALNQNRLTELMDNYYQWMETGKSTLFGENEQALYDAMNEAFEDAKDLVSDIDGTIKDIKSDIEDWTEMLDNEVEKRQDDLDAIGDKIEHILDLNELIYGDQASAQQINLYNMQAQNEENRLKELEKERDIQHQIVEAKRRLAEQEPDNKTWQEEYLDALKKERDIDNDILDTRKEIAEAYKDAKEAANDLAVDNWLNNFQGVINGVNVPLEYMADQWERIQENEDLYLDDLNKAYEIQKLQNKYQQMINDATDPAIQQQITDQMNEQLAYLREKTNLSKYDVDYANAQLEILQKTIALEDARAAKNQMKLRRDSQGNYQYVYAADQNKAADAENDLLDATMEAYNMSKEQQADVQDNYIKKIQEMGDALRKAANDQKLTKEQIGAITQDIIDNGYEFLNAMGEQLDTSQKNMIQSFIDAAFQMQIDNAQAVQDIAQDLQDGITDTLDMVDDRFDTSVKFWIGDDGLGKFRDEADEARDDIISNVQDFEAAVSDANAAIAKPLNEMDTEVQQINSSIEDMTDSMAEFLNLLEQKSGAITRTSDYIADLQSQLTDSQNDLSAYSKAVNELAEKLKTQETINTQLRSELQEAKNPTTNNNSGKKGGGGTGDKGVGGTPYQLGELAEGIAGNIWTYGSWGNDPVRLKRMKEKFGNETGQRVHDAVQKLFNGQPAYGYDFNPTKWSTSGWSYYKKFGYDRFDTGGYTGVWGNDGRLAMLHQKELVLNATDTVNILAAVEAIRAVTDQLKGAAFVNNIANSIGRASQNNIQGSNVEQRVEITANFPNVNSAQEIENALLSLSDTSYQYAYNKNDIPW